MHPAAVEAAAVAVVVLLKPKKLLVALVQGVVHMPKNLKDLPCAYCKFLPLQGHATRLPLPLLMMENLEMLAQIVALVQISQVQAVWQQNLQLMRAMPQQPLPKPQPLLLNKA